MLHWKFSEEMQGSGEWQKIYWISPKVMNAMLCLHNPFFFLFFVQKTFSFGTKKKKELEDGMKEKERREREQKRKGKKGGRWKDISHIIR